MLVVLIAIEIYGFAAAHLWTQEIWYPAGVEHFRFFVGLVVGVATPLVILAPWLLAPLAAIFVAASTIHAVGWAAALTPALFLLSAGSLGSLIFRAKQRPTESALLATLLGSSIYVLLMTLTARLPVHYWWVWLLVLLAPLTYVRAAVRNLIQSRSLLLERKGAGGLADNLALSLLLFILLFHWLLVLKPEAGADGLAAHLAVASNVAAHHAYTVSPAKLVWAVMPMGADWTFAIVNLLGGEFAARLLNFAWFLILLALLHGVMRRRVPRAPALLLSAAFAASPLAQLVTGELFVENFQAALLFGMAIVLWHERPLWPAAALAGTALATKVGSLAFIVVALPLAVRRPRRALAALIFLSAAAPPYVIAWRVTGNPLYPYFNQKFHSPLLPADASVAEFRFHEPLRWSTLYDLTFHTNRYYEGQDGSFGFQFLVLIPLAVLGVFTARRGRRFVLIGAGGMLLVLLSTPNARYLYPALPLLTAGFAAALAWLAAEQRWAWRAALAWLVVCVAANIWFLPSSSWYHKNFYLPKPLSQRWQGFHVTMVSAARDVAIHFREQHPHENVLLVDDIDQADLAGDAHESDWHEPVLDLAVHRAMDLPSLARLMEQWKIRYMILRRRRRGEWIRPEALRELLTYCAAPEYQYEMYYLARIEPGCPDNSPAERPLATVGPGSYDDLDGVFRFRGDWEHRVDFDGPHFHSVSFSDVTGAEAALALEGRALTYVFTKAPNRGVAEIWVDGSQRGGVDLYSPRVEWQSRFRICCLAPGRHELAIRVSGRKTPASQGTFVDVDEVIVE